MAEPSAGLLEIVPEAGLDVGGSLLLGLVAALPDAALEAPTALTGWTRRHLLAHLASNAEALTRLCSWAATGVESRMYASPEQRATEIRDGSQAPVELLRSRLVATAETLREALAAVPADRWTAEVVTAQGRHVPATEVPWMRAREVWLHAIDLDAGAGVEVLPATFCRRLVTEVAHWRSARPGGPALELRVTGGGVEDAGDDAQGWDVGGEGPPVRVESTLPELAGWLTGRAVIPGAPALSAWL